MMSDSAGSSSRVVIINNGAVTSSAVEAPRAWIRQLPDPPNDVRLDLLTCGLPHEVVQQIWVWLQGDIRATTLPVATRIDDASAAASTADTGLPSTDVAPPLGESSTSSSSSSLLLSSSLSSAPTVTTNLNNHNHNNSITNTNSRTSRMLGAPRALQTPMCKLTALALVALMSWLGPADRIAGHLSSVEFVWVLHQIDCGIPANTSYKSLWKRSKSVWDRVRTLPIARRRQLLTNKLSSAWRFRGTPDVQASFPAPSVVKFGTLLL
jgi:hypothetical protein